MGILTRGSNSIADEYIVKAKILAEKLGRRPIQDEFVKAKLGTPATIRSHFGSFDKLLKKANLPKYDTEAELKADMSKLIEICSNFSIDPLTKGNGPDKVIFCNVLSEKYPKLMGESDGYSTKVKNIKRSVAKFLGIMRTSMYHYTQESSLLSIKGYKDYEHKYLIIKAGFLDDPRYKRIKELDESINSSQIEMKALMEDIITEDK